MNTKRSVGKRYVAPTDEHISKWERLSEYKLGPRRTLRPGQVVKIAGQRGAEFEFMYAERHSETEQVNLTFVGGRRGYRLTRSFTPDKVGKFVRVSQHHYEE